jgi:heme-degrading monooxygenase HmoA
MKTIVTHVHLKEGAGREWDTAMRTRLSAAKKRPGWVGGQLLRQSDKPDRRVIVGTWKTRAHWEAWHQDPQFAETRRRLDGLENGPAEHWWHEVVVDVRKYEGVPHAGSRQVLRKRTAKTAKSKAKTRKTHQR